MRTIIYARFSSDNQNPRSTADQIAACRDRAAREGWSIVGTFEDSAISGAAGIGEDQRPGLHAMLRLVEAGGVDQVLAESTDRISRHVADAHVIRERIEFAGARLFTLFDGAVTPIVGLIKGFTDAQFRTDLAARVRRGQRGTIGQGRASGKRSYGYRVANRLDARGQLITGLTEIDEAQAETVRRIFRDYAAGISPRAIAGALNAEGLPPPGHGAYWHTSSIIGHLRTGHGILRNQLYVGRLIYGRTKTVVNPTTRRRIMRPNVGGELTVQEVPHLRIVDDDLWTRVQERLEANSYAPPHAQRRPKHFLSGLGVCGVCGSPWIVANGGNWGCSRFRNGNHCTNNRLIATHLYEKRVIADLKANMLAPDVVAAYVREFHRDFARQSAELDKDRQRTERQLAEASRKVARLLKAFAEGGSEFAEIRELLAQAKADKDRLERELASIEALPKVLTLHPGLEEAYRQQVEDLEAALAQPEAAAEAVPQARAMINRIVLRPNDKKRGVSIEVVRQVEEVLAIANGRLAANR